MQIIRLCSDDARAIHAAHDRRQFCESDFAVAGKFKRLDNMIIGVRMLRGLAGDDIPLFFERWFQHAIFDADVCRALASEKAKLACDQN